MGEKSKKIAVLVPCYNEGLTIASVIRDFKNVIPEADIYVYEIQNQVVAFAGLENNYIAGIFVQQKKRSQGIGKQLLSFLKNTHSTLSLTVYEKNQKALKFYIREGFQVIREGIDSNNNEKEWFMQWDK